MGFEKSELRYLVNELKKIFAKKSDVDLIKSVIDTPPVYTKPLVSLSITPNTIKHKEEIDINLTPKFIQNDAGPLTSMSISRDGVEIFVSDTLETYTDKIQKNNGEVVTYTLKVTYEEGEIKNSTLGVPYPDNKIESGSISTSSNVKSYAVSYYGVSEEFNVNNLNEFFITNKNYTFNNINITDSRFIYMYPSSFGDITSIKDANNFEYINSYEKQVITYNEISYNVYMMRDSVTISNFKQIFS